MKSLSVFVTHRLTCTHLYRLFKSSRRRRSSPPQQPPGPFGSRAGHPSIGSDQGFANVQLPSAFAIPHPQSIAEPLPTPPTIGQGILLHEVHTRNSFQQGLPSQSQRDWRARYSASGSIVLVCPLDRIQIIDASNTYFFSIHSVTVTVTVSKDKCFHTRANLSSSRRSLTSLWPHGNGNKALKLT